MVIHRKHKIAAAVLAACAAAPAAGRAQASGPVFAAAARVDSIFAPFTQPGSPGCAVSVMRGGATLYAHGYGLANRDPEEPITTRTVFDVAATSNQFTAAAVLLLAQDGKLSLDDDVRHHVRELPDYGTPITLRHLLHHTSGLRDYVDLLLLSGKRFRDVTTPADALAALARQKALNFPPGTEHLYSTTNYFLLAQVVERVSGKPLADFARERIFVPLGMEDTRYRAGHQLFVPRLATAYAAMVDGAWEVDVAKWEQVGDGGVLTTVEDLARWDANFYDPRVGGPELARELVATATLADGTRVPYGRGVMLDRRWNLPRVSHGGGWGGYRADLVRFPEQRTTVAVLCNASTAFAPTYALRIAEMVLADDVAVAGGGTRSDGQMMTRAELEPFAGVYLSETAAQVRRVTAEEGKLVLGGGFRPVDLMPLGGGRFWQPGSEFLYEFSEPDAAGKRTLRRLRADDLPTVFVQMEEARPTSRDLYAYAGRYTSREVDGVFAVAVDGDALVVIGPGVGPIRFSQPAFRDAYSGGGYLLRFVRDRRGRVEALTFTDRGVRALRFDHQ